MHVQTSTNMDSASQAVRRTLSIGGTLTFLAITTTKSVIFIAKNGEILVGPQA